MSTVQVETERTSVIQVTKPGGTTVEVLNRRPKTTTIVTDTTKEIVEVKESGKAGPPNSLSIGTVTSASEASATITGTAPSQTLNLVLPISGSYIHNQNSSSSTWSITHNLGFFPAVTVVDSANNTVIGDVVYNSVNSLTVSFSASFGGKAYLS